jgi:hypothetical protein
MKLSLLFPIISFIFFCNSSVIGQSYSVTVTNEPYDSLKNGIAAVKHTWLDPAYNIPVGFPFHYFNASVDSLYSMDYFAGGYVVTNLDMADFNVILMFSPELIDRGFELDSLVSPILYKTEGTAGHRVFTLEYRNAGFSAGTIINNIYTDYVNIQLKIYEENSSISIHIGPYSTANSAIDFEGFSGPSIGLSQGDDFINENNHGEIFLLAGDPLNPTIITDTTSKLSTLQWPIPENTVYTFTHIPTSISNNSSYTSKNYYSPNPTSGVLYLNSEMLANIISPVKIFNSLGVLVLTETNPGVIDFNNFPTGIYELSIQTTVGNFVQRISLIR